MTKKSKGTLLYKKLYKYIQIELQKLRHLQLATLASGYHIKTSEDYYLELDAVARKLVFIENILHRLPHLKKVFELRCRDEDIKKCQKLSGITYANLMREVHEEAYYLTHHIITYEEKSKL